MAALERHPEQRAKYLAGIDVLTPSPVEEWLRYDGAALGLWRMCARDTAIQGQPPAPWGRVFTVTAANHDPKAYGRPDEFIIDRDWKRLPQHLSFDWGHPSPHRYEHCPDGVRDLHRGALPPTAGTAAADRRRETPQTPGPVFPDWLSLEMETETEMEFTQPALPRADA